MITIVKFDESNQKIYACLESANSISWNFKKEYVALWGRALKKQIIEKLRKKGFNIDMSIKLKWIKTLGPIWELKSEIPNEEPIKKLIRKGLNWYEEDDPYLNSRSQRGSVD